MSFDLLTLIGPELVTVPDALVAARLDGDASDELYAYTANAIMAARRSAEHLTRRMFVRQTWRATFRDWPCSTERMPVYAADACTINRWTGSAWVSLGNDAFEFAPDGCGTIVAPAIGTTWPSLGDSAIGPRVRVDLTAGTTDLNAIDPCVTLYIKAQVSAWVRNPEALKHKDYAINPLYASLLDPVKLWG